MSEVVDLTRDGPYQGAFFEKKEEGDARPNKALMQSRLTSLYQGQQKVVEAAPFVEGRMAISLGICFILSSLLF